MRYYPFGRDSIDLTSVQTASLSQFSISASYAPRVYSASVAIDGSPGNSGSAGVCVYQTGPQGFQGFAGPQGSTGTISNAFPYP